MVNAADLLEQIEQQEKKGFFRSLRQRQIARDKFVATQMTVLGHLPFHIKNALKITGEFKLLDSFEKIALCGTGTNSVACAMLKSYLSYTKLDIEVCPGFDFDGDAKTAVFLVSYSGDDEQAIACYKAALRKGSKIIGITSGGRLLDGFKRNNTEHIVLPSKLVESTTLVYLFFPMLAVLDNSKLVPAQKKRIEETLRALLKPEIKELAKQLYEKLQDKIPIIYSSEAFEPVARHWKMQFNLNSKIPAFCATVSDAVAELNSYVKDLWDFYVIFLSDQEDEKEIRKTIAAAKNIIRNKSYGTTEMNVKGTNMLTRYISAAFIGEYTSYFLSQYYKLDEDLVAKFRSQYKSG